MMRNDFRWGCSMSKRELLRMIHLLKKENPGADVVRMSLANFRTLGMPAKVYGLEVLPVDNGFPDNYILTGGHNTCCG